ncbi:MAG: ATP phosphoribosyltransferase [Hyphomicrobiaceae bacterium]
MSTTADSGKLVFAIPSKGRLMDQSVDALARAGIAVRKVGSERGYRGEMAGHADVEVIFISASEIAQQLKAGKAHLGITGEDLIREEIIDADSRMDLICGLGFGRADVVVAVPKAWLDVASMANLAEMARAFRRSHGRRLRVATKYMNLTRGFFRDKGVTDYLIVESLGATEGTPGSGAADLIVDITTTGTTLEANGLKVLDDGVILRSEANLVAARGADWSGVATSARERIARKFITAEETPG